MKKKLSAFFSIVLCIALLVGCGTVPEPLPAPTPEANAPTSAPDPTPDTTPTSDTTPVPDPTPAPETAPVPSEDVPAEDVPYLLSLPGFMPIFDMPSYDGCFTRSVGRNGVFTIVEEKEDKEGNLWGKLKSGAGWVCLTELASTLPVLAGLGSEEMLADPHHLVVVDDAEYMEYLVFDATQTLTDVRLTMLLLAESGYAEDSVLHTLPELAPGEPLIAEVVFYGDFTTYGLSFLDAHGQMRYFAVSISGRNGAPVLREYTP